MGKNLVRILSCVALSACLFACGQEDQPKLPDLPKVEAPKTIAGTYVGRVPSSSGDVLQLKLVLDSLGSALLTEARKTEAGVETLQDTLAYSDSAGTLKFFKGEHHKWSFRKTGDFQYSLLNPTGELYEGQDGQIFALLRILNQPEETHGN